MKISSINYHNTNKLYQQKQGNYQRQKISVYSTYSVSFGIANSSGLKNLFAYGIPDMYTGRVMIDPRKFLKVSKTNIFCADAKSAINSLKRFSESFGGVEAKVFKLMKIKLALNGNYDSIRSLLQSISPKFEKILIRKQKPIIEELSQHVEELPIEFQKPFKDLIKRTNDTIDKNPIILPFETADFKYKLNKIKADVDKNGILKSQKVMIKMLKEAEKLDIHTDNSNIENQKNIIDFMDTILKSSTLKKHEQLKELIRMSQDRLNNKATIVPFTRKSFLYDLEKILDNIPDIAQKEKLLKIAEKLPTSSNSISAYMLKISKESSDKIAYRLCWPSFATIEHLIPQSCGGEDAMKNFGGASARENSLRQSIDFTEQLKRIPKIPQYCQKQMYRLLILREQGVFKKTHTAYNYPEEFAETLYKISKGQIKLKMDLPWYIKLHNNINHTV